MSSSYFFVGFALAVVLALLVRYGYGWAMAARGWLYDQGVFASETFGIPVIALGNLRVGGTGKSPHAAYIVGALLAAGYRVALLSRGYGRQTHGFRVVTPADSAQTVGDEPLEHARRFGPETAAGTLTVAVAERRAAGIRALLAGPLAPQVVVLDDAYQHRAVRPSLVVLLTEWGRPFATDRVLPLGRLREFARAARRADAVVVTKCPPPDPNLPPGAPVAPVAPVALTAGQHLPAIRRAAGAKKPVFFTIYAYEAWQPLLKSVGNNQQSEVPPQATSNEQQVTSNNKQETRNILLLTAIDNPAPLLDHLRAGGFTVVRHLRFPDHHTFSAADLAAVRAASADHDHCPILTTGKDAVRLLLTDGHPRPEVAGLDIWWVPVAVREVPHAEATSPETLRELIINHVRGFGAPSLARPSKAGQGRQNAQPGRAQLVLAALLLITLLMGGGRPFGALAQTTPPAGEPAGQATGQPAQTDPTKPKKLRRLLNDSSQTRYGPQTTRRYYEADLLTGRAREVPLDTTFGEFWHPRRWYRDSSAFQQDLGNVGSGARPHLWPVGQPQAGIRWGRRAFDRYAYHLPTLPFYHTRSPFSSLRYIQGSRGEQVFEARYTRNIKRVFNFGGAYQRLSANKQFSPVQSRDNFLTHAAFAGWAAYATPDSVWRILASYAHLSHEVIEQGPVLRDPTDTTDRYENTTVTLAYASNRELRNAWRVTQLVRLVGPGLQLFYTFDRHTQKNRFSDYNSAPPAGTPLLELTTFPAIYLDSNRTHDEARFRLNQHTAGVLGGARFGSYRLYASRRDAAYRLYQPGAPVAVLDNDQAALALRRVGRLAFGGEAGFRLRDVVAVTADGELQTGDNTYWLRATARYRFLTLSQLRNGYAPTLTEQALYGNHFQWENAFANTQRDESRAVVATRLGQHRLTLDGAFARIRNYVYYDTAGRPQQESTTITLVTAQARWRGQFGRFGTDVRAAYTWRPGRAAVVNRTPPFLADVQVYYQGPLLKKGLFGQVGLQASAQADVRAYAWQPATQQFYVQDRTLIRSYPQIDAFLAADMRNVNVFLKIAHFNQGWPRNGYYVTPGYPQLGRSFTFGVTWLFFD